MARTRCDKGHEMTEENTFSYPSRPHILRCRECSTKSPEERIRLAQYGQRWRRELRQKMVTQLGGRCVCCHEATYEFLHFDHIANDGAQHRDGKALKMQQVAREPQRFQLLCANCNLAKGSYGTCPHSYREWT